MGDKKGAAKTAEPTSRSEFKGLGNPGNIVAQQRIFEEAVKKELGSLQISPTFQVRAKHFSVVQEKPNRVFFEGPDAKTVPINRNNYDPKHPTANSLVPDHSADEDPQQKGLNAADKPDLTATNRDIQRSMQTPLDKYPYPVTSSQDVGWLIADSMKKGTVWNAGAQSSKTIRQRTAEMWYHPRGQCDVVQYANAYVISEGVSPFATKDKDKMLQKPDKKK
eukprot:GDKI01033287.1.p2 GENE.GDKI01033287.1~~GDKI01033287.1.p2  ORF type:complete len:258 (-),score=59.06 GDKI01033287.1:311-973(-)